MGGEGAEIKIQKQTSKRPRNLPSQPNYSNAVTRRKKERKLFYSPSALLRAGIRSGDPGSALRPARPRSPGRAAPDPDRWMLFKVPILLPGAAR